MSGVAFYPAPGDVVVFGGGEEALPEVGVFHRFLVSFVPVAFDPAAGPSFVEGVDDVFAVAVEHDSAGALEGFETGDGGEELHAVVGGFGEAAGDLFAGALFSDENGAEASGAGVAA